MAINYSREVLRAGRALVGWDRTEMAKAAKVSRYTLSRIEEGESVLRETVEKVVKALEKQGLEYVVATAHHGAGVRWKTAQDSPGEGEVLRAGRALVGWNQRAMAEAAKVSRHTLLRVEEGSNARDEMIVSIVNALEAEGVEFTRAAADHGAGVRWRAPSGRVSKPS